VQVYKLREALGLYHFYSLEVSLFQSVEISNIKPIQYISKLKTFYIFN